MLYIHEEQMSVTLTQLKWNLRVCFTIIVYNYHFTVGKYPTIWAEPLPETLTCDLGGYTAGHGWAEAFVRAGFQREVVCGARI